VSDLEKRRLVAEEAVRAAAVAHLKHRRVGIEYKTKSNRRDLVTVADIEAQEAARAVIEAAFPDEAIIGEEDGASIESMAEVLGTRGWLIDPLDGTFMFAHDFPDFSATVAFVDSGESIAGATYAPAIGELFSAARGLGTTLNGAPIRVSPRRGLENAIVNVWPGRMDDEVAAARSALVRQRSFMQRTFGGTALVLAYVAAGRFDVFYTADNPRMGPWDIAAGAILVEEAGGIVRQSDGSLFSLPSLNMAAAADVETLQELISLLGS
jgi:myo-inositol-1(or 4)-monophosphatase